MAALLLACVIAGPAAAAHDRERLSELVAEGRHEQAYELARSQIDAHAGEPAFDFHYGIAAVETGHLNEAVFALERVLIARPGADRARLELARAHFLRGDDRRARAEFEAVEAHDPPADVQARIDRYLLALQRRADRYETTVSGYLEAGAGHDSNVNSATASENVDTIVGPVGLDESSRERSDSFARVEGRARVSHPVAPDVNLLAEAGFRGRFHGDEDAFDTGTLDSRFGALLRRPDWQLRGTLNLGRFYLDGDSYRDQVGVTGSYRRSLSQRTAASVSLDLVDFRFDSRDSLDSSLWLLAAGLTHSFQATSHPTVSVNLFVGGEDADGDSFDAEANASRDIVGIRGGLRLWLASDWTFRGNAEWRSSEYDEPGLLFSEARDEDYYRAELALDWRPRANWRVGPHLEYTQNDSNNRLYDYERTEFQIRARYEFY